MATIDDKVVAMSFESSKFESGVNKTISSLDKLKAALHFPNAGKGFDDINKSASKVDLGHISKGVDEIKSKLGALSVAALAVFAQIAQRAVAAGAAFVKSFTLDPIIAGFQEYATNLNAIQTILANTQAAGTNLKDVNAALDELNRFSDKTIYNFSQMARNIGTFTAAGVDLKTSTASIKGIANLAALSGSNADQAATAMYQLSQAISAGSVKLQDWNSVVNAGMGGTVFQRALAQTAEAMGTLNKGAVQLTGPMKNVKINGEAFRQSLSTPGKASWLTSKVLTQTLKQFTGDLSDAELAAMGFTDAQIMAIQQTAKTAMHAATEVKTIQQVFEVAKETAGSGWAKTFQIIFGTFTEAKKTFTDMSNAINGFINRNAEARNKVLADWKALGGRTVLINSIKTAFQNLGEILKPIKQAFRDIFPATTGKDLIKLTYQFKHLAEALKPSEQTVANLRRTFRGLFALLDIGKQIIGGIFTVFGQMFGAVSDGSGNFLNLTGNIGDFLVSLDQALKKGDGLHKFFVGLGNVLAAPLKVLSKLQGVLANLFAGFSPGGFSGQMAGMTASLGPLAKLVDAFSETWTNFLDSFGGSDKVMQPVVDALVNFVQGFGPALNQAIASMNFEAILAVIRTGLLGGLVLMFKQFLGKGSAMDQITKGFGKGILGNISGSFKALQGSMVALQNNIRAKTLKEIAIAVGILAASVVALSFVDPKRLNSALAAMTVGFGQLLGAMFILTNVTKTVGFIKLPVIAGSLILLAGAIDVLSIAVIALSRLSWNELIKGLTGVGALLGGLVLAVGPLSAGSAGLIRAGVGMMAIAVALRIMANAVQAFGQMNLSTLAKGLGSVAIALGAIVIAMRKTPTAGMIAAGAGMILMATGLRIIANVVEKFAGMSVTSIAKGLVAIGIALGIIVLAMKFMPNMIIPAAGLLIVAVALQGIARAIGTMGGMSLVQIGKGLFALAASLIILAIALAAMEEGLPGAAALTVAASGIALLVPALVSLGKQSWTQIFKGLITLAAALTIIGIAGALITPVIPSLLGLGVALVLIGGGLALAGAGIALIAWGLSALVVAAPTGVGILLAALTELQKGLIENAKLLVLGLLEIVRALANTAPQFVDAILKILSSLQDAIIKSTPKLVKVFDAIITAAIQILHANQGRIIQAGYDFILALLAGIKANIGRVVSSVVDLIGRFLAAIGNNVNKLVAGGAKLLLALLKGIIGGYAKIVGIGITIIAKLVGAIVNNLGKIAAAGLTLVTKFLGAIARNLGKFITAGANIIVAFINGIGKMGPRIITAATNTIIKLINALSKNAVKLANAGAKAVVYFLNGIADAIDRYMPQMRTAGLRIAGALIDGMTFGLASKAKNAVDAAGNAVKKVKDKLEFWHSPPSAYGKKLGQDVMSGLAEGLSDHTDATNAAAAMSQAVIATTKSIFQITSPSKVMQEIGQAVGQGFAQGLKGSASDIQGAFRDMKSKLAEEIRNTHEIIAAANAKIAEEMKKPKKDRDPATIKEAEAAKKQAKADQDALIDGQKKLNKGLDASRIALIKNAKAYVKMAEELDKAKQALADLKKESADFKQGIFEQYSGLPEIVMTDADGNPIDPAAQVANYLDAVQNQVTAVTAYSATLDQLRALGLDDETYRKLLAEGPADAAFANQLLAGGATAVQGLNTLDAQLKTVSNTLATNAANNLYQAGIDSAEGLVKGLETSLGKLTKTMNKLAKQMVRALRKALGIKSPSQEFSEIGTLSMEGLAKGFSDSSKVVTDAVDQTAQDALTALQRSMRDISDIVTDELNPNPTITPILDLTQVRSQSGELAALTNTVPITAATSFNQASAISAAQAAQIADTEQIAAAGGTNVKFEQNNYSPEALTEIEIYRQTKNQLSLLKSSLALT